MQALGQLGSLGPAQSSKGGKEPPGLGALLRGVLGSGLSSEPRGHPLPLPPPPSLVPAPNVCGGATGGFSTCRIPSPSPTQDRPPGLGCSEPRPMPRPLLRAAPSLALRTRLAPDSCRSEGPGGEGGAGRVPSPLRSPIALFRVERQIPISREKRGPEHRKLEMGREGLRRGKWGGVWDGGSGAISGCILRNPALNVTAHHSSKFPWLLQRPALRTSCATVGITAPRQALALSRAGPLGSGGPASHGPPALPGGSPSCHGHRGVSQSHLGAEGGLAGA